MDVAFLSLRRLRPVPWYAGLIEAEDVLVGCLAGRRYDVVLRPAVPARVFASRAGRRALSATSIGRPFGVDPRPDRAADLLVVLCSDLHDLAMATSAHGWDRLADTVVVYLSEVSERHLKVYADVVRRIARRVDHVFIGSGIIDPDRLRRGRVRTSGAVLQLVDVLRFEQRPHRDRPIDVLSFGRRSPAQHGLLRAWAASSGGFYVYDTGPLASVWDLQDHRAHFVDLCSRSRLVVTNYARFDEPHNTGGRRSLGARFIEAAAAGAALCGEPAAAEPPVPAELLAELPVVEFGGWAERIPDRLAQLLEDAEASDALGRTARRTALARLDVAHQWALMASQAGLPPAPGIAARLRTLEAAACHAPGSGATGRP